MAIDGALFSEVFLLLTLILYGVTLVLALWLTPWVKFRDAEQLHVFSGAIVVLLVLWHMKADVQPGLVFHLLGITAVTLMFGWSLAVVAASMTLLGVTINAGAGWDGFALNALLLGVVPATLTQALLILIRWYLPKQFFVFVLVNAFLTAGFVGMVGGYLAAWLLVGSGSYTFAELELTVLPFFPLMFLPEAMLNGWIITVLVAFRPNWVYSFCDDLYLKGK